MNKIHIFKTGKHTSADGTTLEFNENTLTNAATGCDPTLYEAPIVIGHPKSNGPAYGWIKSLEFSDADIHASLTRSTPTSRKWSTAELSTKSARLGICQTIQPIWYRNESRKYRNPIKDGGGDKNRGWPWKRK